jgi:5-methylcytosine-specific restriction enzyme A
VEETVSLKRRTDGVYSSPAPLGPNGERLCRNCHGPMPADKRKHNCSAKCSEEWACKTSPSHLRWVILKRDKGICAMCGLDTLALHQAVEWVCNHLYKSDHSRWGFTEWREFQKALGILGRYPGDLWDADHIVPVIEGGGESGLDNFRTLCIPCHKKATAELAARLAKERRDSRAAARIQDAVARGFKWQAGGGR